jgi:acetyl esterase/lipase
MNIMIAILASLLIQHVDNDIVYFTVDKKKLTLDAYRPPQANGKSLIMIHGLEPNHDNKGGTTAELCRYLSKRGFACFDINYRSPSEIGGDYSKALSAAVSDTIEAFHWVEKHAVEYGGNEYHIALGGISAGATIAMTAAYPRNIGARAVIDLGGRLFGKQSDIKKGAPPLLIVHGLNDKVVNIGIARAIQNRLINVKTPVRFILHEGGHAVDLNKSINKYTVMEHIDTFLRETMK